MSVGVALAVLGAGLAAGAVNTIVGSGSLITFPTLLALGVAPVVANVSNTVGLVPGSLGGAVVYRRELSDQRARTLTLAGASIVGGLLGGGLLLALPGSVFRRVVPVLILLAALLMAAQPPLTRRLEGRRGHPVHGGPALLAYVFATGVYGGYFGAGQGVILISLLAIFIDDDLQRLNGVKNVLALCANLVSALLFIAVTHVDWSVAGLIAAGAVVGSQAGGVLARRLPSDVLRIVVVALGLVVSAVLFAQYW